MTIGSGETNLRLHFPGPGSHGFAELSVRNLVHVGRPKMAGIVAAVAAASGLTETGLRYGRGGHARRVAAWIGWYEGLARVRSIAAALRIGSSGHAGDLVRQCERMLLRNPALQRKVDLVSAAL